MSAGLCGPLLRFQKKRKNISLKTLINALSKFFCQGVKQRDPFDLLLTTPSLSLGRENSQRKEVQTSLEVMRLGLEVTGPEGKLLIVTLALPPYVPSPMELRSESKLCPLQKEMSSSQTKSAP